MPEREVTNLSLAIQDLINAGEKLRLNLRDVSTIYPDLFHQSGLAQIFDHWNEAVVIARTYQRIGLQSANAVESQTFLDASGERQSMSKVLEEKS